MRKKEVVSSVISVIIVLILGVISALFLILYVNRAEGFLQTFRKPILYTGITVIALICVIGSVFSVTYKRFVLRLLISFLGFSVFLLALLYILDVSGFKENFSSVESLRAYIQKNGGYAVVITLIIQILQVIILPIPGIISIGASVALFGPLKGAIISYAGIFTGSLAGFFIGRKLGYKVVAFVVGENSLQKAQNAVKGKDKAFLTAMFLLPFFPDDLLCFVAGLSTMTGGYFIPMIAVTRLISVFVTAYSVNGSIIPYNTAWGASLWIIIFLLTATISQYLYKNGDKLSFSGILKKIKRLFK